MFFQNAFIGKNRWWRWLVTIIGTFLVLLAAQVPLIYFAATESQRLGISPDALLGRLPVDVDRNIFLALFLIPFAAAFFALALLIRWVHKKPFRAVTTGRARFGWRRAIFAFLLWMGILTGIVLFLLPEGSYTYQFDPQKFLPLIAIAFLLFPLQIAAEEVFFRGYLLQGFTLLAKNKLVPFIIVSVLFFAAHVSNPEFATGNPAFILDYAMITLFLGLAAVLDDGLEVPCGIHAANNIFIATIFNTSDGTFQTDALFQTSLTILSEFPLMFSFVPYLTAFIIFYIVFRWRFSTLLETVKPPMVPEPVEPSARPL
ncbi:MAG TPA: CPBP family intramembrane glutamic endopeptidase [Hyphomicrobiales bacterium]|nr:CPBP family intramembrane glutamic endopeptidase [Hyphomicrobiales bacterium]